MVYDPAWDMPQINWQQQGCFEQGSIPPVEEPDAGVQVWLGPINRTYLPWVCGMLDQGRNPSSWIVADDTAMYNILRRWDTLMGLICGNGGSQNPIMMRLQNCVLQSSSDGGTTWTDVPGWADNFASCVRDNIPPPPPLVGPGPIQQYACNLSGFLATQFIQASLQAAVNDWNAGIRIFNEAATLFNDLLGEKFPYANLALLAGADLFSWFAAGTIAALQSAATDPVLWSEVTCAIFNAIKNQGAVTDGNYGDIVSNICGLPYTPHVAVQAICSFVTQMGAVNMRAKQIAGAYDTVDCTSCGGWCYEWDFTVGPGPWVIPSGAFGAYVPGVGFKGTYDSVDNVTLMDIFLANSPHLNITDINLFFISPNADVGPTPSYVNGVCGGTGTTITFRPSPSGSVQNFSTALACADCSSLDMRVANDGDVHSNPPIITKIHVAGTGINPFGADNCT